MLAALGEDERGRRRRNGRRRRGSKAHTNTRTHAHTGSSSAVVADFVADRSLLAGAVAAAGNE